MFSLSASMSFFAPAHIWFGFSAGLPRLPSSPEKTKN